MPKLCNWRAAANPDTPEPMMMTFPVFLTNGYKKTAVKHHKYSWYYKKQCRVIKNLAQTGYTLFYVQCTCVLTGVNGPV